MAKILIAQFEDAPGVPIVVTLSGITRQWSSLSEAVDEVIDARVYSGIHSAPLTKLERGWVVRWRSLFRSMRYASRNSW